MAGLIMIERKPSRNKDVYNYFENIKQYFVNEKFEYMEQYQYIIFYILTPVNANKLTTYVSTIKNTTNYKLAVKNIYTTTTLTKA